MVAETRLSCEPLAASLQTAAISSISSIMASKPSRKAAVDTSLRPLAERIERSKVKLPTLVAKLEQADVNRDGIVHITDLEDLLIDTLGPDAVSQREMQHLGRLLQVPGYGDGSIHYERLHDVLELPAQVSKSSGKGSRREDAKEHWYDPSEVAGRRAALKRGSVGEWLQNASCPAEVTNFQRFIKLLEDFERESGMKCTPTDTGFVVPLGPDLRASITFTLN